MVEDDGVAVLPVRLLQFVEIGGQFGVVLQREGAVVIGAHRQAAGARQGHRRGAGHAVVIRAMELLQFLEVSAHAVKGSGIAELVRPNDAVGRIKARRCSVGLNI